MRRKIILLAGLAVALGSCAPTTRQASPALVAGGLSDGALLRVTAPMDPAMRSLVLRHDPGFRRADYWSRPEGWERLDLKTQPDLGFAPEVGESAEDINALQPFSRLPIRPMRPFTLKAGSGDRVRAEQCLSEAVYYEAAREPTLGQEAVAQVVLNRMRHPAYPKSVCGVVYQGAARTTGCQFTFTCDGSLARAPEAGLWRQAQGVAKRALSGHVTRAVGSATHYHASYVAPYWAPTLVKMTRVGAHIFYRWTGPWGEPGAFVGRYAGGEAILTPALLGSVDERTQGLFKAEDKPVLRKVTLALGGEVRTYTVADPTQADGTRERVLGTLYTPRRKPTPEEIKRINDSLAALEKGAPAPAVPAPIPAPAAKLEPQSPSKAPG